MASHVLPHSWFARKVIGTSFSSTPEPTGTTVLRKVCLTAASSGMDSSSLTASRCQTEGANHTVNGEKESTHEA